MVTTWVHDPDDLERGFAHLDMQRLNAQRGGEGLIVARAAVRAREGAGPRPGQLGNMVAMWSGHEVALLRYEILACREWRSRGYQDYCLPEYVMHHQRLLDEGADESMPDWWGIHDIHHKHRLWLLIRRPDFYEKYGWDEVEEARLWIRENGVLTEPLLAWPRSGNVTAGEGPSPLGRSRGAIT